MSQRLNRQNMKHDKFLDEVEGAYEAIRLNRRRLIGATLAILVAVAIGGAIYLYQQNQEKAAQLLLADGIATMEKPVATAQGAPADAPFKTEQERSAAAEKIFKQVAETYRGRDAADVASLYLAQMDVSRGKAADARPRLEAFLQAHPTHILAGGAQMSLYEIQLGNGETQKVIDSVNQQLAQDSPRLPKDALLGLLAKSYESSGQEAKAKEAYQRFINEYPDSPYAIDAQRKMARG
jgi:TolA-binding protein